MSIFSLISYVSRINEESTSSVSDTSLNIHELFDATRQIEGEGNNISNLKEEDAYEGITN